MCILTVTKSAPSGVNVLPTSPSYRKFLANHGPTFDEVVYISEAFVGADRLSRLLLGATRTLTKTAGDSVRLRAFTGTSLNYELTNYVTRCVPTQSDVAAWLRAIGGPSASVAINEVSRWDMALAHWFIGRCQELADLAGNVCTQFLDTYTFIRAVRGGTPFGIQRDNEPSFIFHLGPGSKTAWTWPPCESPAADIPALNNVSFEIADQLRSARRYVLKPGDFLCIPAGVRHVFENTSPSAFLGISIFPASARRVFDAVIDDECVPPGADQPATDLRAIHESVLAMVDNLQERLPTFSQYLEKRMRWLRSADYVHPPHVSTLAALPVPSPSQPFWRRFPGVITPVGVDDQVFVNGRVTRTGLQGGTARLCELLNDPAAKTADMLADELGASPQQLENALVRLARLGGLSQ